MILTFAQGLYLYVMHCRYLGLPTPEDNLAGYQRSDVTAKVTKIITLLLWAILPSYVWLQDTIEQFVVFFQARKLSNKKYLMVHGTADDNVHYQQSMMLARAMEEADVLFRLLTNDENWANNV